MKDLKKVQEFFSKPLEEAKTGIDMAKNQLDALGVKYEMSKTDKVRPFKVIYRPINKSDKFYDTFEDIVDLFNLKGVVKSSMSEGYYEFDMEDEGPDYNSISSLEDELRRLIRFSNQSGSKGADAKIEQLKQRIAQLKNQINEKQEDPTDIIAMDVPLFLRMLEYAREDAEQDIDLHKVTERAIEAVKLRGLLSMDDYQDIIGEPIDEMTGYSKYLATPENPKGKTQGLTQDVMDKILLKIATMGDDDEEETTRLGEGVIYEELCPKGKAYIKKRQAAGEKSSAYLSGRAVKVCKGQMKG
jgi:ribosomal protein L29